MADWHFFTDQELQSMAIDWQDANGVTRPEFVSGWTFTVQLISGGTIALTISDSDVTKAATAPNVTAAIDAGSLTALTPGLYQVRFLARHTASGKDDVFRADRLPTARIIAAPS